MGRDGRDDSASSYGRRSSRSIRRRRSFCDKPLLPLPTPKQVADTVKSVLRDCRDVLRNNLSQAKEASRHTEGRRWRDDRRGHLEREERPRGRSFDERRSFESKRSFEYRRSPERVSRSRGRETPSPHASYRQPRRERSPSRRRGPPYHDLDDRRSDSIDAYCSSESDDERFYRPRPARKMSEEYKRQQRRERDNGRRPHDFEASVDGSGHDRRQRRGYSRD